MRTTISYLLFSLVCISACGSTDGEAPSSTSNEQQQEVPIAILDLPEKSYDYAHPDLPPSLTNADAQAHDNTPGTNPVTNEGATLGRVLFYDKTLSVNDTIACASCHQQASGFADNAQFSRGFDGGFTGRNSMSLLESRYYRNGTFFWDERAATLEDQVLMPIQNEVEMGMTLEKLVEKVQGKTYYANLFEKAFGDSEVTSGRISMALAQFVRSIASYRSRYDEGLAQAGAVGTPFPNFTAEENQGKGLFLGPAGCARCHLDPGPPPPPGTPPTPPANQAIFLIDRAVNNGLDAGGADDDLGVGDITGQAQDNGKFKSPSLRNVAMSAPYMHDGRLDTLEEVVEHYNSGVKMSPNLDPRLLDPNSNPPSPRRLNLTAEQKAALVAFLKTLTDEAVMKEPMYSDPFVHNQ